MIKQESHRLIGGFLVLYAIYYFSGDYVVSLLKHGGPGLHTHAPLRHIRPLKFCRAM